jgi:AcrR family transcriptional regulator
MSAMRAEATVDEIRRVALKMFAAKGYDGTSIRDIAESVGIRGSSMYNHFPSKEAILWDLTLTAIVQLNGAWEAVAATLKAASPEDKLTGFVCANVRFHANHRREAALINAQLGSLSALHYDEAVVLRAAYEALLQDIVSRCMSPRSRVLPGLKVTVFAILQMCAAVAGWYRPDGELTVEELCDAYAALALKMVA